MASQCVLGFPQDSGCVPRGSILRRWDQKACILKTYVEVANFFLTEPQKMYDDTSAAFSWLQQVTKASWNPGEGNYQWESGKEHYRRVPRMGDIVAALFLKI